MLPNFIYTCIYTYVRVYVIKIDRIIDMQCSIQCILFQTTSQRLADQVKKIIKKGWFSDLEILEIRELLTHISMKNITKINELIYVGTKLECEKIGVPRKNTD